MDNQILRTDTLRIVGLHGRGSNSVVTQFQLMNLGLRPSDYDIVCVNAPIKEEHAGLAVDTRLESNYYSWLNSQLAAPSPDFNIVRADIAQSLREILNQFEGVEKESCIFGFSQGSLIAFIAIVICQNTHHYSAFLEEFELDYHPGLKPLSAVKLGIFANTAYQYSPEKLLSNANLPLPEQLPRLRSIHLIGREDIFKTNSEDFVKHFDALSTEVIYLPAAHEIPKFDIETENLSKILQNAIANRGSTPGSITSTAQKIEWYQTSPLSKRGIPEHDQMASVRIDDAELPIQIMTVLNSHAADAPLFYNSRQSDASLHTSYGQFKEFCSPGGGGDLRRLGVKRGEYVAYLAPVGGSATSAAAFLSIASQTCAVPLAHSMTVNDALHILRFCNVQHTIIFEGVSAPGVLEAFERHRVDTGAEVHYARALGPEQPGLFQYDIKVEAFESDEPLVGGPDDHCLVLRTSGTTSAQPKFVVQCQRDLCINGRVLADGIGLSNTDVTYSIMPLDHIGGISASILATVTTGDSLVCDELFSPELMAESLSKSNPRPTWYSAVPTIHNALVNFIRGQKDRYSFDGARWTEHNLRFIRSGAAALNPSDQTRLQETFGIEVINTYSMSEQMPVTQPPRSENGWDQENGTVGVPAVTSLSIVDPTILRPLPFGDVGEIAISGYTLFEEYLRNEEANRRA